MGRSRSPASAALLEPTQRRRGLASSSQLARRLSTPRARVVVSRLSLRFGALPMRVFITWSGDRSGQIAAFLPDWLQSVNQKIVPFVSKNDIEKGLRWPTEVAERLDEINFGIACV